MIPASANCELFEDDEQVVFGLLAQDEMANNTVINCLYYIHAEDCIRWLIRSAGGKHTGENTIHNAHQAFNDSLLAIKKSVKENRFRPDGKPNSSRRFLYFVSQRCYERLQLNNRLNHEVLPDDDTRAVYPRAALEFPLEINENIRKLQEMLNGMSELCRMILQLRFIETATVQEISVKTGLEKQQVRKRLHSCREKLKKIMPSGFLKK
jgi:RNA polymerase sigma factor (sigma-70 family)